MFALLILVFSSVSIVLIVAFLQGWELEKILLVGMLFAVAALGTLDASLHTGHGGSGVSVGIVTNVSREGFFFQPWGVWIVHQGEMKAEEFGVTQDDQTLIDRLRTDADAGRRVKVYYESSVVCAAWEQPNCDVITRVVEE